MSVEAPTLVTRSKWDAKPYNGRSSGMSSYEYIVIHYSAGDLAADLDAGKRRVREIQVYHQTKWSDIGYHFLIDSVGNVYQGRPFIDDKPLASVPKLALGAHVKKQNSGKIGICLLGCFHPAYDERPCFDEIPTTMMDATVGLASFLCQAYKMDSERIRGHRDFLSTSCPGDILYAQLPSIRNRVQDRLVA